MKWTTLAAVLMGLTVLIHVFAGGEDVLAPLEASLPDLGLATWAAVLWHAVTIVLVVLTFGLWQLAKRDDPVLETVLSGIQIGFAGLFVGYGLLQLGSLWLMPQWLIFIAIPALTRFGQSRKLA